MLHITDNCSNCLYQAGRLKLISLQLTIQILQVYRLIVAFHVLPRQSQSTTI